MLMCTGCLGLNQRWAMDTEQEYLIVVVAASAWPEHLTKVGAAPDTACYFMAPAIIAIPSDIPFSFCLDHELGHLREHLEGFAPHTKYAK